jgi:hypothetical protein
MDSIDFNKMVSFNYMIKNNNIWIKFFKKMTMMTHRKRMFFKKKKNEGQLQDSPMLKDKIKNVMN